MILLRSILPIAVPQSTLFHVGRIVLASLFILGGANKLIDPGPSISMMNSVRLPAPGSLIWAVIGVEISLGFAVVFGGWLIGRRFVALAALLLIAYTGATSLLFHDFWTMSGVQARLELSLFFKNITIMGGLAMVAGLYGGERRAE